MMFIPRVLIIDDLPDVRTMISMVLRVNNFTTVEAASGELGLKQFSDCKFDLVIVDIFLQDTNGIDIITQLRACDPQIPIIAISGMTTLGPFSADPDFADVIFLSKPFGPNKLLQAIEASGIALPQAPCGPVLQDPNVGKV